MYSEPLVCACLNKDEFRQNIGLLVEKLWKSNQFDLRRVISYIDDLRDDVHFYLEYPYVDKVYRDSYYNYFASKYKNYNRNCIRISLFSTPVSQNDFSNSDSHTKLQNSILGYLIIRPLENHPLGRSFLSPLAVKSKNILSALADEKILLGCHQLRCSGFSHISQDTETMSCAESSIWMLIEYYSAKYKEYKPVLPSDITESITKNSFRRLLPSDGLTIYQISQAIKEFGFSTKIYFKDNYAGEDVGSFFKYLYYYIESGIPVVLGLGTDKGDGHAVVAIGHEESFTLKSTNVRNIADPKTIKIYVNDTGLNCEKIIIMDDNHNPFASVPFEDPGILYKDMNLNDLKIKYFIAPLYNKIYLDAEKAYKTFESVITDKIIGLQENNDKKPYVIRFFLTSAKSFKNRLSNMPQMNSEMKEKLIYTSLPKFIWIGEITDNDLYAQELAKGIIIIDATGEQSKESVIFYYHNETMLDKNTQNAYEFVKKVWGCFSLYRNNLKGSWNDFNAY